MSPVSGWKQRALLLFSAACLVLLFLGGPDLIHCRSFKHAWDPGHIAAFLAWSLLLIHRWSWLSSGSFRKQAIIVIVFCLVAGGSVEVAQGALGRYPSFDDVGRDIIGCLIALFFLFPKRLSLDQSLRRLLQTVTLVLFSERPDSGIPRPD